VDQIAERLQISKSAVRNRIFDKGIKKIKTKNGRVFFSEYQIEAIANETKMYYPLKTIVTYHIYESKINQL
jgi:predicted site-specific integrase-resolvase